ncbi:MAG: peptidoglycan-binding domain-containing protein [Acidobacteriota bacterium]
MLLVQATLRVLGEHRVQLDGEIGYETVTAVQRFQRAHGLDPTGVISQDLVRALARQLETTRPCVAEVR